MTDVEERLSDYLQTRASSIAVKPDLAAVKAANRGPASTNRPDRPSYARHRLVLVAAAAVTIAVASLAWIERRPSERVVVADPAPSTSAALGDPPSSTGTLPRPVEDEFRTLLEVGSGSEGPRYVRVWNRSVVDGDAEVLLSEQWYDRTGTAVAGVRPMTAASAEGAWIDPTAVLGLDELPMRVVDPNSSYGYAELLLPNTPAELRTVLADQAASSPGVFATVSYLGPDSSYLPAETGIVVRNLARLLPTMIDANLRQTAFEVVSRLDGVETSQQLDELGREGIALAVPLVVVDPSSGSVIGRLQVTFVFEPETYAPFQIEWRLVEGQLPSGVAELVDTTVIADARPVAAIPPQTIDREDGSSATTTLSPLGETD